MAGPLNDEALRKVLFQIQQQGVQAEKSLRVVAAQRQAKEREKRLTQLTRAELDSIPKDGDGGFYEGVGKMFMAVPRDQIMTQLADQEKSVTDDLVNLEKKAKYLEKQFREAQGNLRDILGKVPGQ